MIHNLIGNIGHFFVIFSFTTALLSTYAYYKSSKLKNENKKSWLQYGRSIFYIHAVSIIIIILILLYMIKNHYFEYYYVWSHSDKNLPIYYMISCLWEGQEGSFLIWIFWNVILGSILTKKTKIWEENVMTVFMLIQTCLCSMILGIIIFDTKIGSSPFILLKDVINAPIFKIKPNFVPLDGTGLNILLKNYWMIIHPPTLFLGFASTAIPFSFCISGLWTKQYNSWIKLALPWALFSTLILGIGISMGMYWAYETLNFGGYWSWDPVENAVYIPWIILISSVHTMMIHNNYKRITKTVIILTISSFILILYSTFLTRSGILGNSSVHSFTDLGLSGQLLIYLLIFVFISMYLILTRWNKIENAKEKITIYNSQLWIIIGSFILVVSAIQVLIPTSIPVYNKILNYINIKSNIAPPNNPIIFYTKIQILFAILINILSGTGQFFWWNRIKNKKEIKKIIKIPIILTMIISCIIIIMLKINKILHIILIISSIYSIISNGKTLLQIYINKKKVSGGIISHIGISIIIIGILFSSGYEKTISINTTGLLYNKKFPNEINQKNILLWINEPIKIKNYKIMYSGQKIKSNEFPEYISKKSINITTNPYKAVIKKKIKKNKKIKFNKKNIISINPKEKYYEIIYKKKKEKKFKLYPKLQINNSNGFVSSPDIKMKINKDIYTYVSSIPDPEKIQNWSKIKIFEVKKNEIFFINDYVATLKNIFKIDNLDKIKVNKNDIIIKAKIKVSGKIKNHFLYPIYLIKNNMIGRIPFLLENLGIKISLLHIHPNTNSFTIGVKTTQKDYIILKIIEKPWIIIMWIGILITIIGISKSTYKRFMEKKI